ncbi:MAG: bifunctional histidinol-phosphatase/imidazoleglycerol-phosphate dehydratase HisB [Bacteroidales bacterium]|nr:bifunctional histidinol-phosphatase/imidazoleglycerol-phosphate dehydratase HisB [Bacteroidales bacterium]
MKKVLFIDRDGTLIVEPPEDYQVDSLEKLEFIPGVFRNLYKIRHYTDFMLVVVSNQDGLGTNRYPYKDYELVQKKMVQYFSNEDISFDAVHIDPSMPSEKSPNRKPGTGMLTGYFSKEFDLAGSYVIGDKLSDVELAKNLGAKAIWMAKENPPGLLEEKGLLDSCVLVSDNWDTIYRFIRSEMRKARIERKTKETDVHLELSLDGDGNTDISTGIGFFDHMLEQIGLHGHFDLSVHCSGDLHVDEHHTVEDTALAMGEAFLTALGNKKGIERYGFVLPMDESLAWVALDFGGRPNLVWEVSFQRERIGDMPSEMFRHFFKSFSDAAQCTVNISATGSNEHHKIEAIFKGFARVLRMACRLDPDSNRLPSSKGML